MRIGRGIFWWGMPVLLDAFDGGGRIVVWSAECERVTGYSAAEILGNRLAIEMLHPEIEYRTSMVGGWKARCRRQPSGSREELRARSTTASGSSCAVAARGKLFT